MVGNLKLEVTNYLRELYGPRGAAHPSGDNDDDDGDGDEEEDLKATPSYQPRKAASLITYSHNIYTTNNTQFFLFFFALNVFFY